MDTLRAIALRLGGGKAVLPKALYGIIGPIAVVICIALTASLCLIGIIVLPSISDEFRKNQALEDGKRIVAAMQDYRNTYGRYPNELSELEPKWIECIPVPNWGTRVWAYEVYEDGQDAFLAVSKDGGYPSIYYDSRSDSWYEDS